MMTRVALILPLLAIFTQVAARLAGECAMACNDLRTEVLTLAMCREAKKTLPKPKVGDFCSTAMEQGFSDACVALCMGQVPVSRISQTCRAAAVEMPRPTVRKWCEHGYRVAFEKTSEDLATHFTPDIGRVLKEQPEAAKEEPKEASQSQQGSPKDFYGRGKHGPRRAKQGPSDVEPNASATEGTSVTEPEPAASEPEPAAPEPEPAATEPAVVPEPVEGTNEAEIAAKDTRPIKASVPVTLDDSTEVNLTVYEGQSAEEAVVAFCREHLSDDVSACIRQLLPIAIEKLEALAAS